MKRILFPLAAALALACAGCAKKESADNSLNGKIGGSIIVLTNRTDLFDTKLQEYKEQFEAKYPGTSVEFEGITDYNGTVRTRMATQEYGDVLCKPDIQSVSYADYFEPLGAIEDFEKEFNFTSGSSPIFYNGTVYCYPANAVVGSGILYNKKVFEQAGASVPETTDEFYEALELIKEKTDAVPLQINYPAGWTLNQWEGTVSSFSGDPQYKNTIIHEDAPFVPGDPHYETYKVMYEAVKRGLCEKDMLSSDWELSKQQIADGKIGCMVLGSWAIPQVKEIADNPDDIGYMPVPAVVNGKKYAEASLDMPLCINKHSKNKATAYAWIKFFCDDTDWVQFNESIPPRKGGAYPAVLDSFSTMGVEYFEMAKAPEGYESAYDTLDKESEIGFWSDPEKKRIIDAAMGTTSESFDDIMNDWNRRWAKARKDSSID